MKSARREKLEIQVVDTAKGPCFCYVIDMGEEPDIVQMCNVLNPPENCDWENVKVIRNGKSMFGGGTIRTVGTHASGPRFVFGRKDMDNLYEIFATDFKIGDKIAITQWEIRRGKVFWSPDEYWLSMLPD